LYDTLFYNNLPYFYKYRLYRTKELVARGTIEAREAEEIAIKFLRQHYSVIKAEKSVLGDGERVWMIDVLASSFDNQKKIEVKVNAMTGMIVDWH